MSLHKTKLIRNKSVFFIHKILPNFNLKNMISTYNVLLVLTSLILILGHYHLQMCYGSTKVGSFMGQLHQSVKPIKRVIEYGKEFLINVLNSM